MEIFFQRLKSAAIKTFKDPKKRDLVQWLGAGPSIRVRTRLALGVAFLVAITNLFVGVLRTVEVSQYAKNLGVLEDFHGSLQDTRIIVERTRADLWHFDASPSLDSQNALQNSREELLAILTSLEQQNPEEIPLKIKHHYVEIDKRIRLWVKNTISKGQMSREGERSASSLGSALSSLLREIELISTSISINIHFERERSKSEMMKIARDQLLLFLVLLFAMPIFVFFVPTWVLSPVRRLHGLARRIREGQVRDFGIVGNDEISQVSESLKKALVSINKLDKKKSAKIFEIRNVLRATVGKMNEMCLVVDRDRKINYSSERLASFYGLKSYQLNGKCLKEVASSKALLSAVKHVLSGESMSKSIDFVEKDAAGEIHNLQVRITLIHNREGDVSRVVMFFQ